MASNKKPVQDENAIDKMNSHLTEASAKIAKNKKIIYIAIGLILAVAAFVLSYLFIFKNPRVQRAYEEMNKIELQENVNDSIRAQQYKAVADKNEDQPGKLAALQAGIAYYNLGQYQEAADYLKKFSSSDKVLDANAMVLTGDCYVNLNKYQDALDWYAKAIRKADGNPQIVPRILLKEANIYDAQKNYNKALECYQTIQNDYPGFEMGGGMSVEAFIARENARLGN